MGLTALIASDYARFLKPKDIKIGSFSIGAAFFAAILAAILTIIIAVLTKGKYYSKGAADDIPKEDYIA